MRMNSKKQQTGPPFGWPLQLPVRFVFAPIDRLRVVSHFGFYLSRLAPLMVLGIVVVGGEGRGGRGRGRGRKKMSGRRSSVSRPGGTVQGRADGRRGLLFLHSLAGSSTRHNGSEWRGVLHSGTRAALEPMASVGRLDQRSIV